MSVTPFLWFDDRLEEAVNFYASVFKDSKVINISKAPGSAPGEADKAFSAEFELQGQRFMALNGGPMFHFTEAISLFVSCKDQAEVDYYWDAFTADGGEESQCGWLKDKFGLSWQIIPTALMAYLGDPDPALAGRVMQEMLQMRKIDVAALDRAAADAA